MSSVLERLLKALEEEYLKMSYGEYGRPVFAGGKHVWNREGLYERLIRRGVKISWEEFCNLLEKLNREMAGRIYTSFIIAPNRRVEPRTVSIYGPLEW